MTPTCRPIPTCADRLRRSCRVVAGSFCWRRRWRPNRRGLKVRSVVVEQPIRRAHNAGACGRRYSLGADREQIRPAPQFGDSADSGARVPSGTTLDRPALGRRADSLGAADSRFVERVADLAAPIHGRNAATLWGRTSVSTAISPDVFAVTVRLLKPCGAGIVAGSAGTLRARERHANTAITDSDHQGSD
jgi:hypothetical protein